MARRGFEILRPVRRGAVAALIAAGLQVAAVDAQAQQASPEALVEFFSEVAFGTEYGDSADGTVYVKKWQQPLRIAITHITGEVIDKPDGKRELRLARARPDDGQLKIIQQHLREIVGLTGVTTEDAKKTGNPVNVQIKLVPRLAMGAPFLEDGVDPQMLQALAQSGVCYFLSWADKSGAIQRALIIANNELPADDFSACMLEELSQIMGLAGESDSITPSVFNPDSQLQQLSAVDRVLLQGLYDDRIVAGAQPAEARAAASRVLPELARGRR